MAKSGFRVSGCGVKGVEAVFADSPHSFTRHIHDQFGIGVMLRGAQKSFSGCGMVEAQEGDVITVNPGEVHDGAPIDDNGRAWNMLYFDPSLLVGPALALTEGRSETIEFLYPVLRSAKAASWFLSLFRIMTASSGGYSELEGPETLLLLLAQLGAGYEGRQQLSTPRPVRLARERIDDDPAALVSLDELAFMGGVSPFQLLRGFSKITGLTPHAYLVQRRLQKARRLIAQGMSLAHAAQDSGFADQSHMTRLFARTYGITPGLYAAAMS